MSFRRSRYWLGPTLAVAALIAFVNVVTSSQQRLERQLRPLINDDTKPPAIEQCADCHDEIVAGYLETGHARTLRQGADDVALERFTNQTYRWTPDGPLYRYVAEEDGLWLTQEDSSWRLPVDWVFGSGGHTQGTVNLITNPSGATEMREHLLAWYPSTGLAPALGSEKRRVVSGGLTGLAKWHSHDSATDCLGCHSTHVPVDPDGRVRTSELVPGVGCARCHPDASRHLARDGDPAAFRERWSQLTPREVIHRCGECHRRAEELKPDKLDSERLEIVRFAPVGLSQSRCFESQEEAPSHVGGVRLDCLSCHNPHRPFPTDKSVYQQVCWSCHYDEQQAGPACASQPQDSDCISCHMPVVQTTPYLQFADHWIRVHGDHPGASDE